MKIHFCDLCNESVPQTDLDEGRAFLRKGRVICLSCDRSMSHPEGVGVPGAPPDGGASGADGPAGPYGAATTSPAAPLTPTGAWGSPTHHTPGARPRGGGGAGFGLGLIAILLIGAVGFWLNDRIDQLDGHVSREGREVREDQHLLELRVNQSVQRVADGATAFELQMQQELRDQRGNIDGRLREGQDLARSLSEKVEGLGGRIEVMKTSFDEVNRHDLELMRLQQKFTSLSDQIVQMGLEFDDLATRVANAPAVTGGAVGGVVGNGAAAEAPPPAWIGLVEQLSSGNPSDRWQAVFALKETGDPAVAEYLVPVLKDEDLFIRMATATALGELGSPVAIPALIDALEDEESAVRLEAYSALKVLTKRDLPFDAISDDATARTRRVKAWRDWWEKEREKYED